MVCLSSGASSNVYAGLYKEYLSDDEEGEDESEDRALIGSTASNYGALSYAGSESQAFEHVRSPPCKLAKKSGRGKETAPSTKRRCIIHHVRSSPCAAVCASLHTHTHTHTDVWASVGIVNQPCRCVLARAVLPGRH